MSFSALPIELKLQIFCRLDAPSLKTMSQVSQECRMLARDRSLERPLLDAQTINNLINKNYIQTAIPVAIGDLNNHYLHLSNGVPTVTTFTAPQIGSPDFSAQIDGYTTFSKNPFNNGLQKTIQVDDKEKCKLQYNALYIDGSIKRYNIQDIAFFNGKILYLDQYREGIFIFDPHLDRWGENPTKIADKGIYTQIVCDEKNGAVYGLTNNSIVKLDFKAAEPQPLNNQKKDRLLKTLSFIGRVIITAVGNVLMGPVKVLINTWKIHAIAGPLAFLGGVGLALSLGTPLLPAGLAVLLLAECLFGVFILSTGIVFGLAEAGDKVYKMVKA